jgi:hypothetical protein
MSWHLTEAYGITWKTSRAYLINVLKTGSSIEENTPSLLYKQK